MTTSAAAVRDQHRASQVDQIRPWRCSAGVAVYCPIHHDCTCGLSYLIKPVPACPLHGEGTTHPSAVELVL